MSTQEEQKKPQKTNFLTKLACGGVAGVVGTSVIFPMDMVKTRLQNQKTGVKLYNGILDCFRKIIRNEGVGGLYRGLGPNLVGVTPEKAIKLAVNDYLREKLEGKNGELPLYAEIAAGAGAGFCQVIATNPMEIVKIQLQVAALHLKPGQAKPSALQVVRKMGIRGVYKGTSATLLRDVPFSMVYFPSYANIKEALAGEDGRTSFPGVLLSGTIAGAIGAACSTPADVVKTRLQVKPREGEQVYKNVPDTIKKIYTQEGPSAFFKGVVPRMCIVAPLFGIALTVYELQQRYSDGTLFAKSE
eukprot:Nk52_evm6s159 gene=Nk52_evmTU6s159